MNDISTGWTPLEEVPQEVKDEVSNHYEGKVSYEKYGQPAHEKVVTYKIAHIDSSEQFEHEEHGTGRLKTAWVVRLEHSGDEVFVYYYISIGPIFLPE